MMCSFCLIYCIKLDEIVLMVVLMDVFGEVFEDWEIYGVCCLELMYWCLLLGGDLFIVLVVLDGDWVVGGLVVYELKKFEQWCSEIYIYDLVVVELYCWWGIVIVLIEVLKKIGCECGVWVIFVQVDYGDDLVIVLYIRLGVCEDVLYFDIEVQVGGCLDGVLEGIDQCCDFFVGIVDWCWVVCYLCLDQGVFQGGDG